MTKRKIKVDYLARVEGEGGLTLELEGEEIKKAHLEIFEPPRYFEAFLQGRKYSEAPDITARICGICPVAYQMSSTAAMEMALKMKIPQEIQDLRRLLYCGEWIESHVLHIFMLHLPDFLKLNDAFELAGINQPLVEKVLEMKRIGNDLVEIVGGREIHPINIKVGGFYKTPNRKALLALVDRLKWAREVIREAAPLLIGLEMPDLTMNSPMVALTPETGYPFIERRIGVTGGHRLDVTQYEEEFQESHVAHSNALHSHYKAGNYFVGPQARYNLNFHHLSSDGQDLAKALGLKETSNNPFESIWVRTVELDFALEEAIRIIENYREPDTPFITPEIQAGEGMGISEAPRGALYHRYKIDEQGDILEAKIVPPTSQNLRRIEMDLEAYAKPRLHMNDEDLAFDLERVIRNYDPCISCATHFLKLKRVQR